MLGLGAAAEADKLSRIANSQYIESGPNMWVLRIQMKSWNGDQSVESNARDTPSTVFREEGCDPPRDADLSLYCLWPAGIDWRYMYPLALGFNDFEHIIYNGLRRVLEEWIRGAPFLKKLQRLVECLGKKDVRTKFRQKCLVGRATPQEISEFSYF